MEKSPIHRRRTPRPPPSTRQRIFQLQPSLYSIMCAVRHISQYVQNRSDLFCHFRPTEKTVADLFCHFSDAPRPWGMQPNTSFRLRMCISPLMSKSNIIPFSPCPSPLQTHHIPNPQSPTKPIDIKSINKLNLSQSQINLPQNQSLANSLQVHQCPDARQTTSITIYHKILTQ